MSYDEKYFLTRESWRDWRIEARELIRLSRIERGGRVLEIGGGGGGLLRMMRERGARVVGVDTLDVALKLAKKIERERGRQQERENLTHPPTHLLTYSLSLIQIGTDNHLPLAANSFDAILGQHVVEHIADTDAALREWHRLLKPNGRLALATPNARYPEPEHFADADHAHIFSTQELPDAVTQAGFVIEECFTAFPFLTRNRILRGIGIIGYNLFRRMPYFAERGRTIIISARKN